MNGFKVSYLEDLNLPIYIDIHWLPEFSEKEIEELLKENKYLLLHPVKSVDSHKEKSKEIKKSF